MTRWLEQAGQDRLLNAIAVLIGGAAGAKLIALAFVPLITRFYSPEAFGVLGSFNAIVTMATPLVSFSLPLAIVLPRSDREALALVRLSLWVSAIASGLLLAAMLLWGPALMLAFDRAEVGWLTYLLGPALFLTSAVAVAGRWAQRKRLFGLSARAGALQSLVQHATMAGWGAVAASGAALVLIASGALMFQLGYLIRGVLRHPAGLPVAESADSRRPGPWRAGDLIRDYRDFLLFKTPQRIVSAAALAMVVPIIAYGYGPAAAGFVTLARIVLQVPLQIVGVPVATAFYQHFSDAVQNGQSGRRLLWRTTGSLLLASVVIYGGIALFAPMVFPLVFGPGWEIAGTFLQWLALWHAMRLAGSAAADAIPALRLQGRALVAEIVSVIVLGTVLAFGIGSGAEARSVIAVLSVAGALTALLPILLAFRGAGRLPSA